MLSFLIKKKILILKVGNFSSQSSLLLDTHPPCAAQLVEGPLD